MPSKTYIDDNGYRRYSNSDKFVHRVVAEKKLGRALKKGEVVHHKDRNKLNNSPSNLWVFKNQYQHDKAHKYDAKRYGKQASYKSFKNKQENTGCIATLTFGIAVLVSLYFTFN